MKLTTQAWIETTATTLATNARGRYVHSMHPAGEVDGVTAQCRKALWEAHRRGKASMAFGAVAVGTTASLAVHLVLRFVVGW